MTDRKVKFGVIGAGGIARTRTIPGILKSDKVQLTAIMNPSEDVLADMRPELPEGVFVTTDWQALLNHPEVEAVYIASPVFAHREQAVACAQAGKHVLLEKPLCRTVEEAAEVVRAIRDKGVKGGTAFMMRFHTFHRQLKAMIAAGELGEITSGRVSQVFWYPETLNRRGDALVWRQIKALSGGGALMDVGVHNIDLSEYLIGSRTAEVAGFIDTRTFCYDVDDACNLLIRLENGAVIYIDGAFNNHGTPGGSLLELYGTKGSVLLQGTVGQLESGEAKGFLIRTGSDGSVHREALALQQDFSDLYTKEIDGFAEAILGDTPEPVPIEQGLWIQKVSEAAYTAAKEKRVVTL